MGKNMSKTILILAANPVETSRLRLDMEVREINEGLRRSKVRDRFIIRSQWAVRYRDIRRALLDIEPEIVHFAGHGSRSEGIFLEDELGLPVIAHPETLANFFKLFSESVKCVLLNSCYSDTQAKAISKHIDYVIGIYKEVGDRAAIEFSLGFYDALGAGKSIESAFEFGRNALALYSSEQYEPGILLYKRKKLAYRDYSVDSKRPQHDQTLVSIKRFLKQTDAKIANVDGATGFYIKAIPGHLHDYVPLPILFAENPTDKDVKQLIEESKKLKRIYSNKASILVYKHPPDALFRNHMARVRMQDRFVIIPIPLAAIEQSLLDKKNSCYSILVEYAEQYLPGADLFDDRNAIGDSMSFFGRGNLLDKLEKDLLNCQGIGLFGLRKSGKTSLLLQLGFALREHPVIHIDLQLFGSKVRFGAALFNQIIIQLTKLIQVSSLTQGDKDKTSLNYQEFSSDLPVSELTTIFVQKFEELSQVLYEKGFIFPIICLMDEIERIFPFPTDNKEKVEEFNAAMGTLRALSQKKRMLGLLVADVHADCTKINQWSQEGVPSNPVYNFFKENFVPPFVEADTTIMLTDIGQLMGISFDDETLLEIHRKSGGHPFVARQLASLLYTKLVVGKTSEVRFSDAKRYLAKPFIYSRVLNDYFAQNIWADLEKRGFREAMDALRIFACNENLKAGIPERDLLGKLSKKFTMNKCIDALLWLESAGLIKRHELQGESYQIIVPLMSQWIRMQMKEEEIEQWHF
jgi:hypothetical protein